MVRINKTTLRACLLTILSNLSFQESVAQDSTQVWVPDIGAPQYFAVLVEDVDRSVEWYSRVFGLRELGGSMAEDDSWRIENLRNDGLFVEVIRDDRTAEADRTLGFRKVGFGVPNIEAVADRIERMTGVQPRVLDFAQYGVRIIQIRDPDGNVIQLSSPIVRPK